MPLTITVDPHDERGPPPARNAGSPVDPRGLAERTTRTTSTQGENDVHLHDKQDR